MSLLNWAAYALSGYAGFLLLLTVPLVQRHLLYLHKVRWPLFAQFDLPEKYGLAPYKTRNYRVTTPDGCQLGVWHVLPHKWYRSAAESIPPVKPFDEQDFEDALASNLTVIFLLGNAATRAITDRIRLFTALSSRLNCNVIAADYRGFADSTGTPDEAGLLTDARSVWDDVVAKVERGRERIKRPADGAISDKIAIMGHSLGTGVASALIKQLHDEGIRPRTLILLAPFTSIPDLLATYRLGTVIPLLSPLRMIPGLQESLLRFLHHRFDSRSALKDLAIPTLIAHTSDDLDIPAVHSFNLFTALQAPGLQADIHDVPSSGVLRRGQLSNGQPLLWWEGRFGGHNGVIFNDGVIDLMAEVMRIDHA